MIVSHFGLTWAETGGLNVREINVLLDMIADQQKGASG